MNECVICNAESCDEHFCPTCLDKGYHFCTNCGATIKRSIYCYEVAGVICKDCTPMYKKFEGDLIAFLKSDENSLEKVSVPRVRIKTDL